MSRFDRYLLSQLLTLFGFFSLVLIAVYWVNRAVSLFDRLIGEGQSAMLFLEMTALTLPNVIRLVLPVAAFAAAAYVTNRLSTESELVVMQATGFSAFRLARPVLVFGLIVALMLSVLVHFLVPASRAALAERQAAIAENVTAGLLREGTFQFPADGLTLYIREITAQGELRDIFLSDARRSSEQAIYTARSALLTRSPTGPKLVMFDGMAQTFATADQRLAVTRFADLTYDIGALISGTALMRRDENSFGTWTLLNPTPGVLEEARRSRAVFIYEGHSRFAQPFLAAAAALIGFSALLVGAFSRFGLWRQLLAASVLLVVMQMIANTAENVGVRDERFWPLVWAAPLFGFAVSAGMLWFTQRRRAPRRALAARGAA